MSVLVYEYWDMEVPLVFKDTPEQLVILKKKLHDVIFEEGSISTWPDYKILRYSVKAQVEELATLEDELVSNDTEGYEDDHMTDDEPADEDNHPPHCNTRRCDCKKGYIWFRDNPKNRTTN